MIEQRKIKVDSNQKELCSHGTESFPMTVNHDDFFCFEGNCMACHWHEDLEIIVVRRGTVRYQIYQQSLVLTEGQGLLINSDVPHSALPVDNSHVVLCTTIIRPVFLYGFPGSVAEREYFRPFCGNSRVPFLFLEKEGEDGENKMKLLRMVEEYFQKRPYGFELKIQSLLLEFFFLIFSENRDKIKEGTAADGEKLRRLQTLLDYLHAHYGENVSLQELGGQVHLSRESCSRFFKEMTGKTITQYLEEYRIGQSLPLLLAGNLTVTQIAELTGFSSASRYARAFRARMGGNPKEYLLHKS